MSDTFAPDSGSTATHVMMMNWRTGCVLFGLASLLACAKATNDESPVGDSGGTDSGGGPSGESGAPAIAGAMNGAAGAPSGAGAPGTAGAANGGAPGHAGDAGTSTGGHSGTSSGGASGAAGKGGATSVGGTGGNGGGSGGATNDGPCANPVDIMGKKSPDLGLAGGCFRTTETFNALGCANFTGGRTIKVNGKLDPCAGTKTTFAPMIGGYNYFEVSSGDVTYASIYWFTS